MEINKNCLYNGDCVMLLKNMGECSVDAVVTDPPYFLDKLDNHWDKKEVNSKKYQEKGTVTSLPAGMKFDPAQGKAFYTFYVQVAKELLRILKPGGYFFSFGPPRLYHNMASAVEDAGFLIKDQFMWLYTQNQPKAQGMTNFIRKMSGIDEKTKEKLLIEFEGWKTPQVRSNHEPIVMAQKPLEGTFLKNQMKYKVGLVNTKNKVGNANDKFVSNVMSTEGINDIIDSHFLISKPSKKEKGEYNTHKTVKPVDICKQLIQLVTLPGAVVLDPFIGSGTTAVACKQLNRDYIGFDLDEENIKISRRRIDET